MLVILKNSEEGNKTIPPSCRSIGLAAPNQRADILPLKGGEGSMLRHFEFHIPIQWKFIAQNKLWNFHNITPISPHTTIRR